MRSQSKDRELFSGSFPEDGAIFMANKTTREECLGRKLFGLPNAFSEFVLKVKRGMVLFLFDYQQRKLYGVFEASTDGGLNLVPDAYMSSSYMRFPAQVRFNVIWECNPLQERDFRDVISSNYYGKNRFNLSLSKDQVDGLLFLFEQTKIKIHHMSEKCHQSTEKCGSVFQRLGGQPEVMEQKSVGTSEDKRHILDTTERPCLCHGYRTSQIKSVVYVVGNNEHSERVSGTLKRQAGSKACGGSKDGERILKKTKTCNHLSVVPDPSQGISAIRVNNECYETPCNTETSMFAAGDAVLTEVDDKHDHAAHFETSSLTDRVEMLIAEFKEYLVRSRMEDQIEEVSASKEGPLNITLRDDIDANAILSPHYSRIGKKFNGGQE